MDDYWVKTLITEYPYGSNDRNTGFEDMSKLNFCCMWSSKPPFHNIQTGIHRRHRHGHKKSVNQENVRTQLQTILFQVIIIIIITYF